MKAIILFFLIAPGLAVTYALILRPMLSRIPALAQFYADANGFWAKVWAYCGKSITVLWGYILGGVSSVLALIDPLSTALGDPDLKSQVTNALSADPKILGYVMMGISLITIASRLRSIGK